MGLYIHIIFAGGYEDFNNLRMFFLDALTGKETHVFDPPQHLYEFV